MTGHATTSDPITPGTLDEWQVRSIGDYSAMARQCQHAADSLVARLAIAPGMRVLNIATGTGGAATAAVLPHADATFDRVLSAFGMMFVPHGRLAATEVVRVLRPGGRFGLCNWIFHGVASTVLEAFDEDDFPGLAAAQPTQWGGPDTVRELFADLDVHLSFAWGAVSWMFASSEEVVRWLEEVSGPVIAVRAAMEARGKWQECRARLIATMGDLVREDIGGLWVRADYLVVLGRRSPAGGGWVKEAA